MKKFIILSVLISIFAILNMNNLLSKDNININNHDSLTTITLLKNNNNYLSKDNGNTWIKCKQKKAYGIILNKHNNVYSSNDMGYIWTKLEKNFAKNIILNKNKKRFYSTDFGNTWEQIFNEETLDNNLVIVYPNPAENKLNVKLRNTILENYFYTINDFLGNIVQSSYFKPDCSAYELNVSCLKSGIYFLRIINENLNTIKIFVTTQPIIIER